MDHKSWQVLKSHSLWIPTERCLIKLIKSLSLIYLSDIVSQFDNAHSIGIVCDNARLNRHQEVVLLSMGRICTLFRIDGHLDLTSDRDCVLSDEREVEGGGHSEVCLGDILSDKSWQVGQRHLLWVAARRLLLESVGADVCKRRLPNVIRDIDRLH